MDLKDGYTSSSNLIRDVTDFIIAIILGLSRERQPFYGKVVKLSIA